MVQLMPLPRTLLQTDKHINQDMFTHKSQSIRGYYVKCINAEELPKVVSSHTVSGNISKWCKTVMLLLHSVHTTNRKRRMAYQIAPFQMTFKEFIYC